MFGLKWKKKYMELQQDYNCVVALKDRLLAQNDELTDTVIKYSTKYPFTMGQVVYDVQLRNAQGRYTKTKPSKEHSVINEVIVDAKNYFKLVERFYAEDVFMDRVLAEQHIEKVCNF